MRATCIFFLLLFFAKQAYPQSNDSISKAANNKYINKDYDGTIKAFETLHQIDSISTTDLLILGKAYYKTQKYRKAFEIFKLVTQREDSDINAYFWLGNTNCFIDTSEVYISSKPYYEIFINKAEPDTFQHLKYLREAYHYMCSYYIYNSRPNFDSAYYYANKILESSGSKNDYLIIGYSSLIVINLKINNYKLAEYYSKKRLEIEPENQKFIKYHKSIEEYVRSHSIYYWQERMNSKLAHSLIKESIGQDLSIYYTKDSIPKALMDTLRLWHPRISFANPDELWEPSDAISDPNLPTRKLIFILKNNQNFFMIFKHGGVGVCNEYIWVKMNGSQIEDIYSESSLKEIETFEKFKNFILTSDPDPIYIRFL